MNRKIKRRIKSVFVAFMRAPASDTKVSHNLLPFDIDDKNATKDIRWRKMPQTSLAEGITHER